jgi:hypothetical protein
VLGVRLDEIEDDDGDNGKEGCQPERGEKDVGKGHGGHKAGGAYRSFAASVG